MHTVCIDATTSRTCSCAAGYVMGPSGCAWVGVVENVGFDRADAWIPDPMATLMPTALQGPGMQDPGFVALASGASCVGGRVTQPIVMPRRSRAEPFVIETTYSAPLSHGPDRVQPVLGLGSSWFDRQLDWSPSYTTRRVCLGAAHYAPEATTGPGAGVSLVATVGSEFGFCDPFQSELDLDHLDIVPATAADACPDPGQVPNGDAEGTGGWTFQTYGSSGAKAAIMPGVGSNGSAGVRLFATQRCDEGFATVPISIPVADATGSPALSLYHAGGTGFVVYVDGLQLPLSGNGQATVDRYCLPAPIRGTVVQLQGSLYVGGNGTCTDIVNTQAILDDVSVANDPACGTDPGVADAGFESGTAPIGLFAAPGQSTAGIVADPAAHGGQRDLALTVSSSCTNAYLSTQVATGAVAPGEGAAVSFWYRLSAGTSSFYVSTTTTFAPTRDGQWHQGFACLDSRFPGRSQQFYVQLGTSSSTCGPIASETASVDDLAVISTPMCPAM